MKPFFKFRGNTIQLVYQHKLEKFRISTGVKVDESLWNGERIIGNNHIKENLVLESQMNKINKIIFDFKIKYSVNPPVDYVKKEFFKEELELQKDRPFIEMFEQFIVGKKTLVKDGRLYTTVLNDIKDLNRLKKKNWLLSEINESFKTDLLNFYLKKKIENKKLKTITYGLNNSTIKRRFSTVKVYMNYAVKNNITENTNWKLWDLKDLKVIKKGNIITLTPQEFDKVIKHDFSNNKRLDYIRDLYLLGCSTGLRYSDVIRLNKDNIDGDYIVINVIKTDQERLRIPLNEISKGVLEKYDYRIRPISNQKVNEFLKDMFKEVGINVMTIKLKRVGGEVVERYEPKYKLLTFHSSRAVFVTFCILQGITIDNIMKWTGHSGDFDVFYKYINQGLNEQDAMKKLFTKKS